MRESQVSWRKRARTSVVALTVLVSGVVVALTPGLARANAEGDGYTCSGGAPNSPTLIPAGTYRSMTVTGICALRGAVEIRGSLTIAEHAGLLATDPTAPDPNNPQGPPICRSQRRR